MQTLAPWTEQWQHFTAKVREQFWGDLAQHTRQSWQDLLGRLSIDARDRYLGVREYERSPDRADAGTGFTSATLSRALVPCAYAWPGHGSAPSYRRALRDWSAEPPGWCC